MTREALFTEKMTDFSIWIRSNCRDSKTGLSLTNIDFVVTDYKKKTVAIIEEKTHMGEVHFGQQQIIKVLIDALSSYEKSSDWRFKGFYLVQFIGRGPEEGKPLFINGEERTVEDLKKLIDEI
jgi:hypothetical protein